MNKIEIPFGAKDSELCGWEYTIPEGMEAVVEGGKVIVRKKESEDERIRKELMEFLREAYSRCNAPDGCAKWLVWLDRQKEQPMSAEEVLIRAGLKPYRDGNQWCVLAGGDIQEGICGFGDTIDEALYQFLMEVLKIQKEQQPAEWSEEDELMRSACITFIKDEKFKGYERSYECIDWLESLRPPLKDREMKLKILKYLSTRCSSLEFEEVEDYLNNLRPSWKPSEEQMCFLLAVINDPNNICAESCYMTIKSLYNDLKKLL